MINVFCNGNLLTYDITGEERVVNQQPSCVERLLVILRVHSVDDIRHISTRIRFASDVYLFVLESEFFDKDFKKAEELVGNILFRSGIRYTLGESCTYWLFNPGNNQYETRLPICHRQEHNSGG